MIPRLPRPQARAVDAVYDALTNGWNLLERFLNGLADAKGDLIVAVADDDLARLAVGTDGALLAADSSTSTGLAWKAAQYRALRVTEIFSGTTSYTPAADARALLVECVGGGGGGGGAVLTAAGQNTAGGGGGAGAYSLVWSTTNVVGAHTVAVGAAGSAGSTAGGNGGAGGDTDFQDTAATVICRAKGGSAGIGDSVAFSVAGFPAGPANGGLAGSGIGDLKLGGPAGEGSFIIAVGSFRSGKGGDTAGLSSAGGGWITNGNSAGNAGALGSGGGGGGNLASQGTGKAGGVGGAGFIRVWEYA